ncbi:1-deoxy-D-xylulose-5-phosphate synthase [Saccharopolyspora terrae]|uniref:1-deoxy-D-xylulose-5-phosphate synthase n=1 Tax=Saccharopolyspora terrae TaxID=2530384 RepID=A0A4R4VBU6_9PSEU|nr:1-deoxy-D-xylulose-5-phosphate synthase [Saccharopolyspora terrae]TDC99952.1 1-deoxy-D-xylulose-5-phosphate synthase [Saccharopolyspora terrae]
MGGITSDPVLAGLSPQDIRNASLGELSDLAEAMRAFLVDNVCATGGHLGPNLGVVELTLALHRVFHSPQDRILFDIGHQAYVHKIITGRASQFPSLRQRHGLSGYSAQAESAHDVIENSHASTVLAYAHGLAIAAQQHNHHVAAVLGDGALTGGMAWEGLNNLASAPDAPVVIVLNDNGRSYAPTAGGIARHLSTLVTHPSNGNIFADLDLHYIGPIDGHDIAALEKAFSDARDLHSPVVVHCLTSKGHGWDPAEAHEADRMHAVGVINPTTGKPDKPSKQTWTHVFGEEITKIGHEHPDLVCITASMLLPTGLGTFAEEFPDRVHDVGIAEQHAVTSAAGLALSGAKPVVALYSTFLNRAFDQALMDVALHRLPVTFVLDRAGITGPDGPSHHGIFDPVIMSAIPGVQIGAPRDATSLRQLLREAVDTTSGPTVIRYPKATARTDIPTQEHVHGIDVLTSSRGHTNVLLVAIGPVAQECTKVAHNIERHNIGATVIDPRWPIPPAPALLDFLTGFDYVFTVEDASRTGGMGSAIAQAAQDAGAHSKVFNLGVPRTFMPHGTREQILRESLLDAAGIETLVHEVLNGRSIYRHPDRIERGNSAYRPAPPASATT